MVIYGIDGEGLSQYQRERVKIDFIEVRVIEFEI